MAHGDLDNLRRAASPLNLDLIDAFAAGQLSRRDFLRRGAILGVSGSMLAAVLAACSVDVEGTAASRNPDWVPPTPTAEPTAVPTPTPTPRPTAEPTPAAEPRPVGVDPTKPLRAGVLFAGDYFLYSGLDPINMLDLGTYAVVSQSFEYLVGLAPDGFIGPTGLAESWRPNEDGTQWTFNLRPDVLWQSGDPFTSMDVAATIDRMVANSAGLTGMVSEGATETPDDLTVVVNLDRAVGNLPVMLSTFNPQSLITPVDYSNGTVLDERPTGTGPWRLVNHEPGSFTSVFEANNGYWGGRPPLDEITLVGFETQELPAAFSAGEIDVIQHFEVFDGSSLLEDDTMTVLSPPSANHRQVWFNTQLPEGGPMTNALVRQAVAYCVDRQQVVDEVYQGRAIIANDHPIHPSLPFFDGSAVEQRSRDIDRARGLLAEAGFDEVELTIEAVDLAYSAELARVLRANCAAAGIRLDVRATAHRDFYGERWCPGQSWGAQPDSAGPTIPCGASAAMGIVDYGHRPIPEIYLDRALTTDADWNSSNFASADFDVSYREYEGAVDVAGQLRAISDMQRILHEETPVMIPAFFDYLAGHRTSLTGVQATSLGHLKLDRAEWIDE